MGRDVPFVRRLSLFGALGTNKNEVSGAQRGRERHAAPAADAHGGRLAARAQPPRPLSLPRNTDAMELADVPRHRPLAFDKMESLIKEMQDPETGVPVRSQKLFLSVIPSAFMGYDLVEWIMDRFNLDETSNVEAINLANQLCQYGYFFPVNDLKNLVLKDDSSLYRFQSPYYWPWQGQRVAGSGSSAPSLGPDNIEYAIYLVKRTLRNKQRHALDDYEQEALANLKKNLAAKWDFITMQAEEQVRLAKDRKKGDKIVSDSQERAYWRVARPPPGAPSALEPCPVPVRARNPRPKKRNIEQLQREIEHLKLSLDRTRVKTSIALEALIAYSETFTPYDPWLTPPQPSNPWISDDTLFWQINSPLVDVPSEKRVQRWALSIEELVSDPTGLQEFTSFLRKEYSHENIRFWLAVMDLRRSSTKQIPKKLEEIYELQEFTCFPCMAYSSKNTRFCLAIMSLLCSSTKQISKNIEEIYEEFLKPGAPCEINIDGATAEKAAEGLRSGSRYALDHAADHVYGLLLKKDCYPRFVRSDHFQRLLTEGRNVHQKKAKFFNFGGQVKKKPCVGSGPGSAGGAGAGPLSRRRGSDRSLSGSAHELAVCATHAPPAHSRAPEPPPHSHSQSNLCDLRDPLEDSMDDVLPWESTSREGVYGARRRQDSAADSGSSSSDVSAAVAVGVERARRLPQQSTLDGGLRGAPPPLRRLSAVEPRHLAPLGSPPHSPRQTRAPPPTPAPVVPHAAPPHPTPTISVSSAPDDESTGSPPGPGSPDDRRSLAHSDEPSSVFASADATPTEPTKSLIDRCALATEKTVSSLSCDNCRTDVSNVEVKVPSADEFASQVCALSQESCDDSPAAGAKVDSKVSDRTRSFEEDVASVRRTLSREPSTTKEISPASNKDSSKIGDLPGNVSEKESVTEAAGSSSTPEVSEMAGPSLSAPPAPAPKEAAPAASTSASLQLAEVAPMPMEESRVEQTCAAPTPGPAAGVRAPVAPVAPLAVGEDIGADDDNVDKVPSAPLQRVSGDSKAASESDATKRIAHKDELSSVSESNIVKRDNKSDSGERKQRNDICPWEDE